MKDQQTIYSMVRDARCAKGMTQSQLAELAGCRQSAVSMFEGGRAEALSRKTLAIIAENIGLDAKALSAMDARVVTTRELLLKYCSVDACPSNVPYAVRDRLQFVPSMIEGLAGEQTRCRYCGDVLEERCPNADCRAKINEGAYCDKCGTQYVSVAVETAGDPESWADKQRHKIAELRQLSQTNNFVRRSRDADYPGAGHDQEKSGGSNHVEERA